MVFKHYISNPFIAYLFNEDLTSSSSLEPLRALSPDSAL